MTEAATDPSGKTGGPIAQDDDAQHPDKPPDPRRLLYGPDAISFRQVADPDVGTIRASSDEKEICTPFVPLDDIALVWSPIEAEVRSLATNYLRSSRPEIPPSLTANAAVPSSSRSTSLQPSCRCARTTPTCAASISSHTQSSMRSMRKITTSRYCAGISLPNDSCRDASICASRPLARPATSFLELNNRALSFLPR